MLIRKAYKFRLKPSAIQEEQLRRYCGCARFVWNKVWRMNHDWLERGHQRREEYTSAGTPRAGLWREWGCPPGEAGTCGKP